MCALSPSFCRQGSRPDHDRLRWHCVPPDPLPAPAVHLPVPRVSGEQPAAPGLSGAAALVPQEEEPGPLDICAVRIVDIFRISYLQWFVVQVKQPRAESLVLRRPSPPPPAPSEEQGEWFEGMEVWNQVFRIRHGSRQHNGGEPLDSKSGECHRSIVPKTTV